MLAASLSFWDVRQLAYRLAHAQCFARPQVVIPQSDTGWQQQDHCGAHIEPTQQVAFLHDA